MSSHARTASAVVVGVQGHVVDVEAHLSPGLPAVKIVGLPDASVGESRDRARAAVLSSGLDWPATRLTIGLSPAWLPKQGTGLDLAIAMAALAADGTVPREPLAGTLLLGELALDGRVRPVRGVMVAVAAAVERGLHRVVVPAANAAEAALVPGAQVIAAITLRGLVAQFRGDDEPVEEPEPELLPEPVEPPAPPDLADVRGHVVARRALEVAAAGGHHLVMLGPPGVGKTMLAERLPSILPPLGDDEALEVTAVHSVAGRLAGASGLVRRPPLCAPHHSASFAAMVGGGSGRAPSVGLVSLAHRGVLFLDEAPEFAPQVLDSLRQPMESGQITVARVGFTARLPARFQLVLAANPCPCGMAAERSGGAGICSCTSTARRRYLGRLSGPLLDRVDVRTVVHRPTPGELADERAPESSAVVAERVAEARDRAGHRYRGEPWRTNAEVPTSMLRRRYPLDDGGLDALERLARDPALSLRGLDRVARLAWTVADLRGHDRPSFDDVSEAAAVRSGRGEWAA